MRAHFVEDLKIQDQYNLTGNSLHHLVNVVRVETGEELLLLNGAGLQIETIIESITKKSMSLKFSKTRTNIVLPRIDLALGMPKREALELCLKQSVELGLGKIWLIKSEYSQMKFPEEDRLKSLLVSALEQSNAAFLPKILKDDWKSIPYSEYEEIILMDSQTDEFNLAPASIHGKILVIVGPEGGFSEAEKSILHHLKNVKILKLKMPILRTPTAVAAGVGIASQRLLN